MAIPSHTPMVLNSKGTPPALRTSSFASVSRLFRMLKSYYYCHSVAVTSVDGMTADWAKIPYDVMGKISNRIINEVKGVNRVAYDISSKPPSTIEWE